MSDLKTVSPDQLGVVNAIPEESRTILFNQGGPLMSAPFSLVISELLAAYLENADAAPLLAGGNLSDLVDVAVARGNLGLTPGTDVQAHADLLDKLAALSEPDADLALGWNTSQGEFAWGQQGTGSGLSSVLVLEDESYILPAEGTPQFIELAGSGVSSITVPSNLPVGFTLRGVRSAAGSTQFMFPGSDTVGNDGAFYLTAAGGEFEMVKVAHGRIVFQGDLSADAPPPPVLAPGAGWTGVAGTGFTIAPADPERLTAKPALQLLTAPNQVFTDSMLVGVIALANDNGSLLDALGIEHVIVHFEGNSQIITAPSFRTFADANGNDVSYFGWWATLEKPSGTEGEAHVYFEAVARDTSMQHRVKGPYSYFPKDTRYDLELTVDPGEAEAAGVNYQSVGAALNYIAGQSVISAHIHIVGGAEHNFVGGSGSPIMPAWCDITAENPVTFTHPEGAAELFFRVTMGRVCLRGNNITVDFANATELYNVTTGGAVWCDGVNLTYSPGRGALRNRKSPEGAPFLIRGGGYLTECTVDNLWRGGSSLALVRGGTFTQMFSDLFSGTDCVIGTMTEDLDSSDYRVHLDALSVTGPAGATLEMSGGNQSNNRVITARENGTSVGTLTVSNSPSGANFTVADVAAWVDGLSGWSAVVIDNDRFAAALQANGTSTGSWGPIDVSSTTVIQTFMDIHADVFQTSGEDTIIYGNIGFGIDAQVFFQTGSACRDFFVVNNAFDTLPSSGLLSQFTAQHSHVVHAHNTLSAQTLIMKFAETYAPDDYCLFANNVLPSLTHNGTPANVVIDGNHVQTGGVVPPIATETSTGGSRASLLQDAASGDFEPTGALLENAKLPVIPYDAFGTLRDPVGDTAGAVDGITAAPAPTPTPTPTPAPAFTTQPSITDDGTPQTGEPLVGNDGVIDGGTVSERAWLLNGTALSGADSSPFTPTHEGVYRFRVRATGPGGTTEAISDPVTVTLASAAGAIILIVAGQSNSRKAATDPAAVPARYTSLSDAFIWHVGDGSPRAYIAGTNSGHQGADQEWGTEAEVIHQMRAAGETRPIYVVHESQNGQALADVGGGDWWPDNNGERFAGLETQMTDLRAWLAANTPHTAFDEYIFWNQGEADSDSETHSTNYRANKAYFLTEFRSRISTGFFISERIRPLGYGEQGSSTEPAGYTRAYRVREGTITAILGDGNGAVIDTDFFPANFPEIHPFEPDPWVEATSWTTQIGQRAFAAIQGTYDATYGAITDTAPDAFVIPADDGAAGTEVISSAVALTGFERRAPVSLPAGVEMRVLNSDGNVHTDWTSDDSALFVDKFQTFTLRATAPAVDATDTHTVTIGGVSADWAITGTAAASYRGDTQLWLDALDAQSGPSISGTQESGIDTFLANLDSAGILPKIGAHAYALGSEIANRIRLDDPSLVGTQEGLTDLPWANGYKATDNGQHVDLKADPAALTTVNSVALTIVVSELVFSSAYSVNSADGTLGMSIRNATTVRFRAHGSHVNMSGLNLTKVGPYTGTSDGSTGKLYDPDGIEIASVPITPNVSATAADLLIGSTGLADEANRIWGVCLATLLDQTEVAALHGELQTLRGLF